MHTPTISHIHAAMPEELQPQQTSATCDALDGLIASRNTQLLGSCTKNSLCTTITCTSILSPEPLVVFTNVLTFFPCTTPMSINYLGSANGGTQINLNSVVTESEIIEGADPIQVFNITLDPIDGGVNYGVSSYILQSILARYSMILCSSQQL